MSTLKNKLTLLYLKHPVTNEKLINVIVVLKIYPLFLLFLCNIIHNTFEIN